MRNTLAILLTITGACAAADPAAPPARADGVHAGVVAHRGASHQAPENTMAALARAWAHGAEGCEIDVRVSRDGQVVLMHDETTRRTGGVDRPVAEQTLAELRALEVGSWHGERYRGERVPTLPEVLATIPAGRTLFVEIKGDRRDVPAVAAAIRAADPRPRGAAVALQAFDPAVLAEAAALLPGVPAFWTVDRPVDPFTRRPTVYPAELATDAAARGFAGLAVDERGVDRRFIQAVARAGLVLDVWTVNEPGALAEWRRHARWVETDRPDLAR